MALPFFRALNPTKTCSGIQYYYWEEDRSYVERNKQEIADKCISEVIQECLDRRRVSWHKQGVLDDLHSIHKVLCGQHYQRDTPWVLGRDNFSKGLLDYFIFPLIARKLIADTYLNERERYHFTNALAWMIAVPLEVARISIVLSLILLAAPVVAIVNLIERCQSKPDIIESSIGSKFTL